MAKMVKRRPYDSPQRRAQALVTRRAILDAARHLFIERGYGATTLQAIADKASVSVATVYAAFVNKRTVLEQLVDVSIAGDDEPVAIADRPWVAELANEPDRGRRIRMLAANGRRILERRSAVDAVVQAAAASDPEIATLWEKIRRQRREGQGRLLPLVAGLEGLGAGLDPAEAADVLYAIASPETYRLLVE
ncbi:MAG: helix-turn-helix domain-containing protein, partial [Candidatus Limnocylindria bacterium]